MFKLQRPSKKILIFVAAALIAGAGSFEVGYEGVQPIQILTSASAKITQSRCDAGAFVAHSDSAMAGVDSDATVSATTVNDPATQITQSVPTSGSNLFPNSGLETLAGSEPASWSNGGYGQNNAAYSQVLGHNSARAVRIDITKYTSGIADWNAGFFNVTPGGYYQFTDYYRANVITSVLLNYKDSSGNILYTTLSTTPASLTWEKFTGRFIVPTDVTQVQVVQALARVGSLETDDYGLYQATPIGFAQPMVSVTFDDGWRSAHDNALPIMKRYDLVATQYIISGYLRYPAYDTPADVYDFQAAGDEIASHTVDHLDLTRLTAPQVTKQVSLSAEDLGNCFGRPTDFAYPYGTFDPQVIGKLSSIYQTARSTSPGINTADYINPYELKVENVLSTTTPDQMAAWLQAAKDNHAWLILVYHKVDNSSDLYTRSPKAFESDVQQIMTSGLQVKTMHQAWTQVQTKLPRGK